jgi:hypothetical protein
MDARPFRRLAHDPGKPPYFFVIVVLVIGAVWIVVNWSYSGVLASKNGQKNWRIGN